MEIFIYVMLYLAASFIVGLLMVIYWAREDAKPFTIFEIFKSGFSTLSFIVLLIAYLIVIMFM